MSKRGSALILTLLVVSTLTGLALAFSWESNIELDLAGYSRDGYRAYQAARAGVYMAMVVLNKDENMEVDSLDEDWAVFGSKGFPAPLDVGTAVSGKIMDENSKLNLNKMLDKSCINEAGERELKRLFGALGLEEGLAPPILDWLDADNIERLEGAESYYYRGLDKPYECANSPLLTIGQIFLIKGIKDHKRFGEKKRNRLTDFLTIASDGKININTASKAVLQCLSDKIDSELAEAIVEYRKDHAFTRIDEIKNVAGMDQELFNRIKDRITVRSSAFSIEVVGRFQETETAVKAIVLRTKGKMRLIYWQVI